MSRSDAAIRGRVTRWTSSRKGSILFWYVVHDIPLMGHGVPPRSRSSASAWGHVNALPLGSTPPATSRPLISGGGNVSGTFTVSCSLSAAVRSRRNVRSFIDRYVTGRCLSAPGGSCSRMSHTSWSSGSTPVRNEGHADHECVGMVERNTPFAPRSMSAWRLGRAPASRSGSRIRQSAPSQPISRTRDMSGLQVRRSVVAARRARPSVGNAGGPTNTPRPAATDSPPKTNLDPVAGGRWPCRVRVIWSGNRKPAVLGLRQMTEFPRVGDVFAGHRIEALIGRGGMGVVYLGEHLRLGRKVAVKVLSSELAQDALFRERFLREARAAATLDHPNIVSVYDAGEVGDIAYFSMQYIEGADLAAILRQQGALEPADAVAILREVASALDAAQAEGFVHRDVKPANILLQRERSESRPRRAYLSDFGITKRLEADGGTTGQFLGTIDYMAPEQITGGTIDGRTDQYSLACVLFQCLTGRVPFPRDDQVGVMYAHLQETPAAEALGVPLPARAAAVPDDDRTPRAEPEAPVARRGPRRLLLGVAVAIVAGAVVSAVVLWGRGPAPGAGGHPTGEPSAATSPSPGPTGTRSPESTPTPFPAGFSWMRVPDPGHLLDGADDQTMNRAVSAASKVVAVGYEGSIDSDAAA